MFTWFCFHVHNICLNYIHARKELSVNNAINISSIISCINIHMSSIDGYIIVVINTRDKKGREKLPSAKGHPLLNR